MIAARIYSPTPAPPGPGIVPEERWRPARIIPLAAGYFLIGLLAAFLLFTRLGERLLWGDEAETAVLAVNITKYGLPLNTDGRNTVTLLGPEVDANASHLWTWSPWLDEYLAAGAFAILGRSALAARLPFAAAGLAAVILLALLVFFVYRRHGPALAAMALLASSELFILEARQCRYYAIVVLAQIWLLFGVYRVMGGSRRHAVLHIAAPLLVQFYCNYITVGGNLLALAALFAVSRRRPAITRPLLRSLAAFFLLACPWLLYARPWKQAEAIAPDLTWQKIFYYVSEIHFHIMPLAIFAIPVLAVMFGRRARDGNHGGGTRRAESGKPTARAGASGGRNRSKPPAPEEDQRVRQAWKRFLVFCIPAHLLFLFFAPGPFQRYLTPLIPVLIILGVFVLTEHVRRAWLRYPILGLLCCTNYIQAATAFPVRGVHAASWTLPRMVRGLASPYADRSAVVAEYLRKAANPDDTVFVFDPEFPLIFHAALRIIDGRFSGGRLPDPLPVWIFAESATGVVPMQPLELPEYLAPLYEPVRIEVPDSRRGGGVPDPDSFEYFTAGTRTAFLLYHKK